MFVLDCNCGPFGSMRYSVTVYLEVDGERYAIETAYTKSTAKDLSDKWAKHAKTLGLTITVTNDAQKFFA
jgi:hypothetical protein